MTILSGVANMILLYCVLVITRATTGSRRTAFYIALTIACVWAGASGFHELRGGFYDSVALCLLVMAMSISSPVLMRPLPEDEVTRIYRETLRPLYAYVSRRVGGDIGLAEDFVQEAWMRALDGWPGKGIPGEPLAARRAAAADPPNQPHRFSEAGRRERDRLEMYGVIGDIWRGYSRLRKIDAVNQQGVGVRREIVCLPGTVPKFPHY
ncbi:MAG TPA: hypothetical protein VGG72_21055 [Bryobacteraceae bacterium]